MGNAQTKSIEMERTFWSKIAKDNGWYKKPFFIQVWIDENGEVEDSVSHTGLTEDLIIKEVRNA